MLMLEKVENLELNFYAKNPNTFSILKTLMV